MNDQTARDLLRGAVADADVDPAPVDELVRRGVASRRRTHFAQVGGVAAAVAGLIIGGVALTSGDSHDSTPPASAEESKGELTQPAVLQAPMGMRYVGMGPVVVGVPAEWGTNLVKCGVVLEDTVVFDSSERRGCLAEPSRGSSSVHIVSATSPLGRDWLEAEGTTKQVGGVVIKQTPIVAASDINSPYSGALVVESHDVVIWAESPDDAVVRRIFDSVRIIPDGYVTIPYDPNAPLAASQQLMQEAGLEVQVVEEYREGWSPGSLIASAPLLGTPVLEGSTVTLTVTSENQDADPAEAWPPTGPEVERPAAVECVHFYPQDIDAWGTAIDATVTRVELGAPHEGLTPATVTLDVHQVLKGPVPTTVRAKAFDVDWLLPADPQDAVGVRIITALGRDLSMPACGFTRPWSVGELARWQTAIDGGLKPGRISEQQLAEALHLFALEPSEANLARIPFADEVGLGLGSAVLINVPRDHTMEGRADLSDAGTWRIDVPHFRGYSGPFTALSLLRDSDPAEWQLSMGRHPSCVGRVVEPSPELAGYLQLSIEPAENTYSSCLDWWSVDVFLDESGRIHAITLDLFEP